MAVWPTTGMKPSAKSSTPQIAARTRMRRLSRVETHRSYQKERPEVGTLPSIEASTRSETAS